VHVGVKVGFPS